MKRKNWKQLLQNALGKWDATPLKEIPEDIKRNDKFPYKCKCGKSHSKSVRMICNDTKHLISNALCRDCAKKIGIKKSVESRMSNPEGIKKGNEKRRKTIMENFGGYKEMHHKAREKNLSLEQICKYCQTSFCSTEITKFCKKYCKNMYFTRRWKERCSSGDITAVLSERHSEMVNRNGKRGIAVENTISLNELYKIHEAQNGCCKSCGNEYIIACLLDEYNPRIMSPDRIDNTKGYISKNVQWTCLFCNNAQSDFEGLIWSNIIDILLGKTEKLDLTQEEFQTDCSKYKPWCVSVKDDCPNLIDRQWFYNRFNEMEKNQKGGRCEITDLPLFVGKTNYHPLLPSIDRCRNGEQHTKDNCGIVASFINRGRNKMKKENFKKFIDEWFPNKSKNISVIFPPNYFEKCIHYRDKKLSGRRRQGI